MPKLKPFKGWRYGKESVHDLASVLAPPYDVISTGQQNELYKKNRCNVIHLILGKIKKGDTAHCNQYTRAYQALDQWISKGILIQDPVPSIYVYVQDYKEAGKTKTRLGFMAAMRIDEKAVLMHENTLAKPKKDRLALLKEVRTNLSPIFGLFEDRKGTVQKILKKSLSLKPDIDVSLDGVRHRLYVENRDGHVNRISELMASKPMMIADGHHRFEVACEYKKWMQARVAKVRHKARRTSPPQSAADWDYVMTYFSDLRHNPFQIFPTHRLISIQKSMKDPLEALRKRGRLRPVLSLRTVLLALSKTRESSGQKGYLFGIYKKKEGFFIFDLATKFFPKIKKNPVDQLDVAVLHRMLIEPCFKIKSIEKSSAIDFTRDPREAQTRVDQGDFDMAFFLRPTSLNEMISASKKGLKMPQKSTYFYPKLLSGLVFHRFENKGDSDDQA